ncbi:hypothetical protein CONPUDRAFT_163776 [Coniophora puteana RWD-64-598 SS2]|uniref:TECPR1-like DysF domain-containing protein n=1 Tax=Coniophora puteana (strain RWD-64-598) TaxID=741705 RepID=A0A5M3MU90_CONPW|nr:uncharacterized protein CONPUDRAFT_163776 [Coniophora puteana RWD-64-598 SS2]EIW82683.1 hypothetical protein CONPUDRAFT_163776 [Coniophora puteana RWD-64-598 SS2]
MSDATKKQPLKPKILQMPHHPPAPSVGQASLAAAADAPPPQAPSLLEFVSTVPPPLAAELIALAPYIHAFKRFVQILSWQTTWDESWLMVASWWAFCLLSEPLLRYFLPIALVFVLVVRRWTASAHRPPLSSSNSGASSTSVASEATIQGLTADLAFIRSVLLSTPSLTLFSSPSLTAPTILRVALLLYAPYLILTYFVPLRIVVGIAGTLLLSHRARWARTIHSTLTRSAHVRWATYRAWSALSGVPLPPPTSPARPPSSITLSSFTASDSSSRPASIALAANDANSVSPAPPLRFLFTVYENQRWWMGLDFTAALLPNERPAWCGASHEPMAPPAGFALPGETVSYVYADEAVVRAAQAQHHQDRERERGKGKGGGKGDRTPPAIEWRARVKRTARWTWDEPEWRVVVRREGASAASDSSSGVRRVEKTPPRDDGGAQEGTALKMLRAARGRDSSIGGGGAGESPERGRAGGADGDGAESLEMGVQEGEIEEPMTDAEGWVYGDNKWEGASSKGGMGKYTRYRRWTRIALLTETVELVGPGPVGIFRGGTDPSPSSPVSATFSASPSVSTSFPPSAAASPNRPIPSTSATLMSPGSTATPDFSFSGGTASGTVMSPTSPARSGRSVSPSGSTLSSGSVGVRDSASYATAGEEAQGGGVNDKEKEKEGKSGGARNMLRQRLKAVVDGSGH